MSARLRLVLSLSLWLAGCAPAGPIAPAAAPAGSATPVIGTLRPEPALVGRWRFAIKGGVPIGAENATGPFQPGAGLGEVEVTAEGVFRWLDNGRLVEGALVAARPSWDYLDYKEWSYYRLRSATADYLLSWNPETAEAKLHYLDGIFVAKGERL
jgi:hypothetical protein